jgi:hypothetical protein
MKEKPYSNSPKATVDDQTIEALQMLSRLMDRAFTLPGTKIQIGADSILGLIPGIGDTLTAAISGYIYTFAKKAGVPGHIRAKMIWNIFIDWLIGSIPLVGDLFDIGWKANTKNVKIITEYYQKQKDADILDGDYTKVP